jgi:hypothetical protein
MLPMRAWGTHVALGLAVVAAGGAVASACAHDDSTIYIYNALAQPAIASGATCTFTPNPTQAVISTGTLDVSLGAGYVAEFLVGNQMVAQVDPTVPRTETSIVDIQGAVIRITDSSGNQLTTYTDLAAGSIPAASGGTPGYLPIAVTIVNPATVNLFFPTTDAGSARLGGAAAGQVRLVTYTKVFGKTLGGQYVESNEFEFPVTICSGCLIHIAQSDISTVCPTTNCLGGSAANIGATQPCAAGQDIFTDCSLCRLSNPLCDPGDCLFDAGRD